MQQKSFARFRSLQCDNLKSQTCPEPSRRIENRKWAGLFAIVVALTVCGARAEAQQPAKVPHIGYLVLNRLSSQVARVEAFRQGLRELGYVEGKNIVIDWRSADGKLERLPALAAELVRLKVDIIVTTGPTPTRAVREATSTISIVLTNDPDPVANGFVVSLARPGGNITGLSTFAPELSGKRLEILREVVSRLSRVAVLGTSTMPGYAQLKREIELAAKTFGVKLQYLDVLDSNDVETAFRSASKGKANAVLTIAGGILFTRRAQIMELAVKNRLPVIYHDSRFVEAAGLCSTALASSIEIAALPPTWTRSSKAQSPQIFPSNSRRSSSW